MTCPDYPTVFCDTTLVHVPRCPDCGWDTSEHGEGCTADDASPQTPGGAA